MTHQNSLHWKGIFNQEISKRLRIPRFPILMGAIGPRMLDLVGEIADGLIMMRRGTFSVEYQSTPLHELSTGDQTQTGRNRIRFLGFFETCISEDGNLVRQFAKRILGTYTIPELPPFVSNLARINEREIQTVKQRYLEGDLYRAIMAVTDEMVDAFSYRWHTNSMCRKLKRFTKTV